MSSSVCEEEMTPVEIIYEKSLSSIEAPWEEWSSLLLLTEPKEMNLKKILHSEGLYDPGSDEECATYIALSDSEIYRHPYYKYPPLKDPGIMKALLYPEPKKTYDDDGQDLYIDMCREIGMPIINIFHRSLLSEKIDLSYYGVDKKNFRAIALTLQRNIFVSILDLTDNWMDLDSCYHIGEMLSINEHITELNLEGCNIGVRGAKTLFHFIPRNRSLIKLNLSKNKLNDEGARFIIKAIEKTVSFKDLNLSYNNLSTITAAALTEVLEFRNTLTHLNLSWNLIHRPQTIYKLCQMLAENNTFETLDLSWNSLSGPRIGLGLKSLMNANLIRKIILNNNSLYGEAIKHISKGLIEAKNLDTLDLSFNPLKIEDALFILQYMWFRRVKLRHLLLDNVIVNENFMEIRKKILSLKFRKGAVITHGYITPRIIVEPIDLKLILFRRIEAISKRLKKKKTFDFGVCILQMYKDDPEPRIVPSFLRSLKKNKINLGEDLLVQLCVSFAGPRLQDKHKSKTVSVELLKDYVTRLWPEKKCPPTPPPVEIVEEVKPKEKDKKKRTRK